MQDNKKGASRIKDLEQIKEVFDKYGVRFFVVYGALLGHYRDGDFIEHDDDIDLAVIDPIDYKTRFEIGWMLYDLGFQPQPIAFNIFGRMVPAGMGYNGTDETGIIVCERNFKFTIFFFKPDDECFLHSGTGEESRFLVCVPMPHALKLIATPEKFFEKPGTIKINKKKYLTPAPIEDYLEFTYENWKDKLGRDHGKTYNEMMSVESIDDTNAATIFRGA